MVSGESARDGKHCLPLSQIHGPTPNRTGIRGLGNLAYAIAIHSITTTNLLQPNSFILLFPIFL